MVAVVENDITPVQPSGVWGRAFALLYDPFLWVGERTGFALTARSYSVRVGARWRLAAAPA